MFDDITTNKSKPKPQIKVTTDPTMYSRLGNIATRAVIGMSPIGGNAMMVGKDIATGKTPSQIATDEMVGLGGRFAFDSAVGGASKVFPIVAKYAGNLAGKDYLLQGVIKSLMGIPAFANIVSGRNPLVNRATGLTPWASKALPSAIESTLHPAGSAMAEELGNIVNPILDTGVKTIGGIAGIAPMAIDLLLGNGAQDLNANEFPKGNPNYKPESTGSW